MPNNKQYLFLIYSSYKGNEKAMRIIADHIRTAVFVSADPAGIKPSNTDQGYILRRLIRRAIRHAKTLNIDINSDWEQRIAKLILDKYKTYYKELVDNENVVYEVLASEKTKFNRTLEKGLREFEKVTRNGQDLDGATAFRLFDTFGFPLELTEELAQEQGLKVDSEGFALPIDSVCKNLSMVTFFSFCLGDSQVYRICDNLNGRLIKELGFSGEETDIILGAMMNVCYSPYSHNTSLTPRVFAMSEKDQTNATAIIERDIEFGDNNVLTKLNNPFYHVYFPEIGIYTKEI